MASQNHVVVKDDTLWDLAGVYYQEPRLWPVLAAANDVDDPRTLAIGQVLVIPDLGSKRTYEVVPGDELGPLAVRYYGDFDKWSQIAHVNGVKDPRLLPIGQLLWIPDGEPAAPPNDTTTPGSTSTSIPQNPSVPTNPSDPTYAPALDNSTRDVLKGTLVALDVPAAAPIFDGPAIAARRVPAEGGLRKLAAMRQLALSSGDVDAVRQRLDVPDVRLSASAATVSDATYDALSTLEQSLVPSLQPDIASAARIPSTELAAFAETLVAMRNEGMTRDVAAQPQDQLGRSAMLLNTALVAARALADNTAAAPIGMLNLERIEMTPNGIQRGELISTIPLAPGEQTAVTHKEWSVTSKEFTTIVTDSLEDVSETGVTDNVDLAQSTSSQTQHSNQFNITGTVQGGIPIISGSSTTTFTAQDSASKSANESIKHARTTTQKASSRSRQEHKTTISTKTVTGSEETSTRILRNTGQQPMRIDYFSLMRKWRVRLYRYGLRLTYDVVIPEPAAAMRRQYAELEALRAQQAPFEFVVKHSDVTNQLVDANGQPTQDPAVGVPKYQWLADQYGVSVKPFPGAPAPVTVGVHAKTDGGWWFQDLEFDVPAGCQITDVLLDAQIGKQDGDDFRLDFDVIGNQPRPDWNKLNGPLILRSEKLGAFANPAVGLLKGQEGHQKVVCFFNHAESVFTGLTVNLELLPETIEQWRDDVWEAMFNAAQTRYYSRQQDITARIADIEERLAGVDTLTLRREESDEIMKGVLRFVLGADFEFMSDAVLKAFQDSGADITHGIGFDGSNSGLTDQNWALLRRHEDTVRFINQAIEWENVVSFLYSYFWDVPPAWPFVRDLRHPDATRQAFLRAGSARVVLTVRKGWEERWIRFAEGGSIDADIDGRYLTIAQEIAAYDDHNYPGIPPANPARAAARLQDAVFTTCAMTVGHSAAPQTITVESTAGFVAGLPVLLDSQDERNVQESVVVTAIPSATELLVGPVSFDHDGATTSFAVLQPGEKGALIAEWNEYTPTSGTDIAVTSNLATIA